jgi:Cdc6-like AAA superfamily ATPase
MQEINGQMALRLHQKTGEPLAHCSYLLAQTNGDYETALKILERILEKRGTEGAAPVAAGLATESSAEIDAQPSTATLEQRVERLEYQLAHLTGTLETMSETLTLLLDKLSGSDQA